MSDSVARALALIDDRLAGLAGPPEIADALDLPLETLRRAFRREVGMPLGEYLVRRRVREDQRLLSETDLRAYEVGVAVGWHREDTASHVFRRETGVTMQAYRKDARQAW